MRVTERLIFDTATRDTARAREAAERAKELVSRGTRVEHPGDDPAASGLIVASNISRGRHAAIAAAATAASDELAAADGALDGVSTALSRARQLAVQFSSAGYTQAQSAGAALEVKGLLNQIVSHLNARVGNRYVFGGYEDAAPPFDPTSGIYSGDSGVRNVEIAPGVFQQANILVGSMSAGASDPSSLLNTLQALQTALQANDQAGVQATLGGLDAGTAQVAIARSQAGVSMNAFDAAALVGKAISDDEAVRAAKLGEADLVDSSIRLAATQQALEATLAVTAQSFKLSLLNFLT